MKNLMTFKLVYETRSFSRAAVMLYIAQPTVSAQIKQLEAEFGTTLFIRNGRGVLGVTPAATALYEKAAGMLATWDELHLQLGGSQPQQRCIIAASHTFATALLPQLLPRLYRRFPEVRFSVQMLNSQAVTHAVSAHDADIGIIEQPLTTPGLTRQQLLADQLVRVGASGPWLVRESDSGVGYYTRRYLAENDIQTPRLEVASNAVIVGLLQAGFGQSIISSRAAEGLASTGLGERYRRQFYLVTRPDALPAVVAAVKEWGEEEESRVAPK